MLKEAREMRDKMVADSKKEAQSTLKDNAESNEDLMDELE